jgi:hypothetical protein
MLSPTKSTSEINPRAIYFLHTQSTTNLNPY